MNEICIMKTKIIHIRLKYIIAHQSVIRVYNKLLILYINTYDLSIFKINKKYVQQLYGYQLKNINNMSIYPCNFPH